MESPGVRGREEEREQEGEEDEEDAPRKRRKVMEVEITSSPVSSSPPRVRNQPRKRPKDPVKNAEPNGIDANFFDTIPRPPSPSPARRSASAGREATGPTAFVHRKSEGSEKTKSSSVPDRKDSPHPRLEEEREEEEEEEEEGKGKKAATAAVEHEQEEEGEKAEEVGGKGEDTVGRGEEVGEITQRPGGGEGKSDDDVASEGLHKVTRVGPPSKRPKRAGQAEKPTSISETAQARRKPRFNVAAKVGGRKEKQEGNGGSAKEGGEEQALPDKQKEVTLVGPPRGMRKKTSGANPVRRQPKKATEDEDEESDHAKAVRGDDAVVVGIPRTPVKRQKSIKESMKPRTPTSARDGARYFKLLDGRPSISKSLLKRPRREEESGIIGDVFSDPRRSKTPNQINGILKNVGYINGKVNGHVARTGDGIVNGGK